MVLDEANALYYTVGGFVVVVVRFLGEGVVFVYFLKFM